MVLEQRQNTFRPKCANAKTPGYIKYMEKIRLLVNEGRWSVQEVDHVIWEYDRRNGING